MCVCVCVPFLSLSPPPPPPHTPALVAARHECLARCVDEACALCEQLRARDEVVRPLAALPLRKNKVNVRHVHAPKRSIQAVSKRPVHRRRERTAGVAQLLGNNGHGLKPCVCVCEERRR